MSPLSRALLIFLLAVPPSAAAQIASTDVDALIARIETARVELDIPAVGFALAGPDRVLWSGALGIADRASARPADSMTEFRIGSITKMFTALALLIAQDDGRLDLNSPARAIAPDFPMQNPWEASHPVRVAQLLEHTAGLQDLSAEEFDRNEQMELTAALAWKSAKRRALWPPGLHSSYSNVGAGLAAFLLERVTGERYEDYIGERIFKPLGMTPAGFFPDRATLAHLATGYDADGKSPIRYWNMLYRAFGAINATPSEMAPFIQLLLNQGEFHGRRIIGRAAIDRMEIPATTLSAAAGLRYGYGLGNYTWLHHGVLFHGHGGDADGYLARLGYSRDRALGYFLVINVFRDSDLERLRSLIEDFIVGDARADPPPPRILDRQTLEDYAGNYQPATSRFPQRNDSDGAHRAVEISVAGNELVLRRDRRSIRLIPVTDRLFRRPADTVATSAFVEYDGHLYFQDDGGNYVKSGEPADTPK